MDGKLYVTTIVNTQRYAEPARSSTELVLNELEDRALAQLREIRDRAEEKGVDIETECFHGDPSEEILAYADEIDADLIVLGYQGRTHPRSKIGSTADQVARNADRSVLLV
jgi:nucleotide-binding universal stress UspA family protein